MNGNDCMCGCGIGECGCTSEEKVSLPERTEKYEAHNITDPSQPYYFHFGNIGIMPHWHENIEILRFHDDSVVVCDREEYSVGRNNIAVVNQNSLHASPRRDGVKHDCLIVDTDFLMKSGIDVSSIRFDAVVDDVNITALFDKVEKEVSSARAGARFGSAAARAAILSLVVELCRSYSRMAEQNEKTRGGAVKKAIGYIKSHLDERLTVDMIAGKVNVSKYYFCREFHRETGFTVIRYINNLRCRAARELLMEGKYSISEVARMCGFENASYFSRIYKNTIGTPPSASANAKTE